MTDLLYKYLSLDKGNSEWVESIFVKNQLWFSKPGDFNDPFDCAIGLTTEGTSDEWFKFIQRKARDLGVCTGSPAKRLMRAKQLVDGKKYQEMQFDIATKSRSEVGVCCLSATRDNLLMWAHYAASHTGLVLEFKAGPHNHFFDSLSLSSTGKSTRRSVFLTV